MSNIENFIRGGGFVMYPLLTLSLAAFVVIVERLLAFRVLAASPPGLLAKTLRMCSEHQYEKARHACSSAPGPMAASMAVVLSHHTRPVREIERMVEETGQEFFIRLERYLPVLDTTTTIAPLLGLLGTIVGMIGAFNAISLQQNSGHTDAVLAGVGQALYATATGLTIAVICFIFYNYFSARLRRITSETEQGATRLINLLVDQHHLEQAHSRVELDGVRAQ